MSQRVGIGTDGASVMCGKHHSLYSLIKAENPHRIHVKCTCDSLHLAYSEATSALPSNIEFLVREIYSWFSSSPKRQEQYRLTYVAINDSNPLKLVSMSNTRWLSVTAFISRILEQWNESKLHFEVSDSSFNRAVLYSTVVALDVPE